MAAIDIGLGNMIASLTTADLYYGKIDSKHNFKSTPAVNWFRIPSVADSVTGTSLTSYQVSIRGTQLSTARSIAESLIDGLSGYHGLIDQHQVVIYLETDGGDLYEDDGEIVHIPLTFNVRHVR